MTVCGLVAAMQIHVIQIVCCTDNDGSNADMERGMSSEEIGGSVCLELEVEEIVDNRVKEAAMRK